GGIRGGDRPADERVLVTGARRRRVGGARRGGRDTGAIPDRGGSVGRDEPWSAGDAAGAGDGAIPDPGYRDRALGRRQPRGGEGRRRRGGRSVRRVPRCAL